MSINKLNLFLYLFSNIFYHDLVLKNNNWPGFGAGTSSTAY